MHDRRRCENRRKMLTQNRKNNTDKQYDEPTNGKERSDNTEMKLAKEWEKIQ